MKEETIKPDIERGFTLLYRLLRLFPYNISIFEQELNKSRSRKIGNIWNRFWNFLVFDRLDSKGYHIPFEFKYHSHIREYNLNDYYDDIEVITKTLFEYLNNIELKPKKNTYFKTSKFISLRLFFKILFKSLNLAEENGGWKLLIRNKNTEEMRMFYDFFGFLNENFAEKILSPEEFRNLINEIFETIGYEDFSLNADGELRYFEATAGGEEKKRAYNILSKKKFENVIKELDNIYDHCVQKKYNDALAGCRKALESFYKRFLINHGINTLHNGKNTEDGVVSPLAQTIKNNINILFTFPSYSNNLDSHGIPHLIESSKFMISGMANPGGSHGKSSIPNVKKRDVKVAESFLILLINTLLPFEK